MRLRKKMSLLDQASDYVEAMRPQVEAAVSQAFDAVEDFVETTALPALQDAREKAGPALVDARTRAATTLAEAREAAAPVVADARAKAAPMIASGAALAGEKASAVKEIADAKIARIKGEPVPQKGGRLKKVVLLAGLAAAVGVVAKKLQGGGEAENWQSSYVPSPPPSTSTDTPSAPADTASTTPVATTPAGGEDDPGGASPDEAIADQVEEARPVTTPDDPAEVVQVDDRQV